MPFRHRGSFRVRERVRERQHNCTSRVWGSKSVSKVLPSRDAGRCVRSRLHLTEEDFSLLFYRLPKTQYSTSCRVRICVLQVQYFLLITVEYALFGFVFGCSTHCRVQICLARAERRCSARIFCQRHHRLSAPPARICMRSCSCRTPKVAEHSESSDLPPACPRFSRVLTHSYCFLPYQR